MQTLDDVLCNSYVDQSKFFKLKIKILCILPRNTKLPINMSLSPIWTFTIKLLGIHLLLLFLQNLQYVHVTFKFKYKSTNNFGNKFSKTIPISLAFIGLII